MRHRQTNIPGINTDVYINKWSKLSIDKLMQVEADLQEAWSASRKNISIRYQVQAVIDLLQKYIQHRYHKEASDPKNKKLGI